MKAGNLLVLGFDSKDGGYILLRFWDGLGWGHTSARRRSLNAVNIIQYDAIVLKGQAGRNLAHLLMGLPLGGFFGLDDEIADAHLLNERHHFLPGTGTDGEHGNHGRHSEDHAQQGQQGAKPVQHEVLQAELHVSNPLLVAETEASYRW